MTQVKTGISLDAELFEAAERLAQELCLTRSVLYARALEELIERRRSKQLLDELNAAYGELPDPDDGALLRGIRRTMRRVGDPWE
jgi:predicted transcriptional regulator